MRRRTFLKSIISCGVVTLLGGTGYAYRSRNLEVSHEMLAIPSMNEGLRIVAASDLHLPCFYSSDPDLVTHINSTIPDIFLLAGDTIDERGNESLVGIFKAVNARFAKLAVLGNWELQGKVNLERLKREYEKAEFSLLVNNSIEIAGLVVLGLDDFICGSPNYQVLNRELTDSSQVLVVSHCPESFDYIASVSPNPVITISGHTHGGQIAPFGVVLHTPVGSGPYVHAWYTTKGNTLCTCQGALARRQAFQSA